MMQPQIIVLKEGTEASQGRSQVVSNINACQVVADAVRTTLGPRGMDKLIVEGNGRVTISNDGATIVKLLDIVHPAAKTLVEISKSQDAEVGDGTTTVTLLAAEFLKQVKTFVEDDVHPQVIIRAYRKATQLAMDKIKEIAVRVPKEDVEEHRSLLRKCAATTLSSKLVASQKDFFANMVVEAVSCLDDLLPMDMIGIKKIQGGSLEDSILVAGVAFKKTFSYAGFEMQRKKYALPKIALLNVELELKSEKENAEIRVESVDDYQAIVDAEWTILYNKLEKIHLSGAKVVLSKLPIGDVATQYFADRDMFCAGRVVDNDLKRTMQACGGAIQTSVQSLTDDVLGTCEQFEENQVGGERFNFFTGCPKAKTCTLILRGGAEQFIEETERSLHDAIMIVRRAIKNDSVVAGGGAIEMELSKYLRDHSRTIAGKQQILIGAYAKALEIIPRQLCDNAGFDATNVLNKLRQKHAQGGTWYGVDIYNEDVADNFEACVWEPSIVKINALTAASEAACLILSVDETIKNPKSSAPSDDRPYKPMGRGRGRPR
ncbi:T-complex protein 1 subunit eta isoform X2 [Strongylocentrotus purpuratus]|uniref:T-complex protein 1 subunit eta n=1 Tax=Strongylocentrotus purpuratus TaxID=7668 RepID=A0A7M7P0N0_STRPU|nr:T-complex protein 1 subunit eta isoform X2 [Strongylocentrotus purpuratus]|eukprot:XP_011682693.1 PREDICTED: T-complex protein 1 subunit eta isoform X2 [Strongylocentrotus purpuratus]